MKKIGDIVVMYIGNVIRSLNQVVWSIVAFRMIPRIDTAQADPENIRIRRSVWNDISARVIDRMKNEGITFKLFGIDDFFDCVEFARCFVDYFHQTMVKTGLGVKGKGIPMDVYAYQDKIRKGHACIVVKIDNEIEYYEPYPEYFKQLDPDREEIATMRPVASL